MKIYDDFKDQNVQRTSTMAWAGESCGRNTRRRARSTYRLHCYYNESWQLLEGRKEVSGTEDTDPLNQYLWHPYYIDALAVRWYDATTTGTHNRLLLPARCQLQRDGGRRQKRCRRGALPLHALWRRVVHDRQLCVRGSSGIGNEYLYTGR